ncbi:MAG: hypothetical protein IPN17_06165 [Deltaproteobacteria bacterium]|nr:hypothetical protein [Deltaproteobacteria bacterium]
MDPPPAITRFCLDGALAPRASRAHVIGVSGPQGGGKSTLTARLVAALGSAGLRAATVSIDDFYLTHAEQRDLAARHPGDRCLEHRGYPGTHDVALGDRVLGALASQRTGSVAVPSYDKSAHGGRGDRASAEVLVEAPLDVVLVEGWMLGFRALPRDECPLPLRASNDHLPRTSAGTRASTPSCTSSRATRRGSSTTASTRSGAPRGRTASALGRRRRATTSSASSRPTRPTFRRWSPRRRALGGCASPSGPTGGSCRSSGRGATTGAAARRGAEAQVAGVPSRAPWNIGGREGIRSPSATGRSISTARAHRELGRAVEASSQRPLASRATP